MSDRSFKLRQMYNDYLDLKIVTEKSKQYDEEEEEEIPKKKVVVVPAPQVEIIYSSLPEDERKRLTIPKIVEEQKDVFETCEGAKPMLIKIESVELKWAHKAQANNIMNVSPEDIEIARKFMKTCNKANLFEAHSFKAEGVRLLYCFFKEDDYNPTPELVTVLDDALTFALTNLSSFSDKISVVVDMDTRKFMQNQIYAKRVVLDVLLRDPDLVPSSWGGEFFALSYAEKMKDRQKRAEELIATAAASFQKSLMSPVDAEKTCRPLEEPTVKKKRRKKGDTLGTIEKSCEGPTPPVAPKKYTVGKKKNIEKSKVEQINKSSNGPNNNKKKPTNLSMEAMKKRGKEMRERKNKD